MYVEYVLLCKLSKEKGNTCKISLHYKNQQQVHLEIEEDDYDNYASSIHLHNILTLPK